MLQGGEEDLWDGETVGSDEAGDGRARGRLGRRVRMEVKDGKSMVC